MKITSKIYGKIIPALLEIVPITKKLELKIRNKCQEKVFKAEDTTFLQKKIKEKDKK